MTWRTHLTHAEQNTLSAAEAMIDDAEHPAFVLGAASEIRKLKHVCQRRARAKRKETR